MCDLGGDSGDDGVSIIQDSANMHEVQPALFYQNVPSSRTCASGPLSSSQKQGQPFLSTSSRQLHSKPSMGYPQARGQTCETILAIVKSRDTSHVVCLLVRSFVLGQASHGVG